MATIRVEIISEDVSDDEISDEEAFLEMLRQENRNVPAKNKAYYKACKDHQKQCHPRGGFIKGSGLHYDRRYHG